MRLLISRLFGVIFSFFIIMLLTCPAECQTGNSKLKTVVIDPGHGGNDPGAVSGGVQEKDIVLAVAQRLGKKIKNEFPDVKVIYTRTRDVFIPLYARAALAVRDKADVFISLHANYVGETYVKGTETFTLGLYRSQENLEVAKKENSVILLEDNYSSNYQGFNPKETESYIMFENMQSEYQAQSIDLAAHIQKEFTDNLKRNNRGVKQAGFLVLRETSMPAVLVEIGFITNPEERKFLVSEAGKEKVAESIFEAFSKYKRTIDNRSRFDVVASHPTTADTGNTDTGKNIAHKKTQVIQTKPEAEVKSNHRLSTRPTDAARKNQNDTIHSGSVPGKTISGEQNSKDTEETVEANNIPKDKSTSTGEKVSDTENQPVTTDHSLFYSVQVGAIANPLEPTPKNFKGEKNIFRIKVDPYYKYYSGKFATFSEAFHEKSRLADKYPDAFVVIVENNIPRPYFKSKK